MNALMSLWTRNEALLKTKKPTLLVKFSLLAISLVLSSCSVISSVLPLIEKSYPNVSVATVELITTIPALTTVIGLLLSTAIVARFGKRKTIGMGLVIIGMCGNIPMFTASFTMLLVSRIVIGFGFGMFNTVAVNIFSDYFEGSEKDMMIGFQIAFMGMGAAAMTFCAGEISQHVANWRFAFLVYTIAFPILLLFLVGVPKQKNDSEEPEKFVSNTVKEKFTLNTKVVLYAMLIFVLMMLYNVVNVKLAEYVAFYHLGTTAESGELLSSLQVTTMLLGFSFGYLYKKIQRHTMTIALTCLALSFCIFARATTLNQLMISVLLDGAAIGLYVPYILTSVQKAAPAHGANAAVAFVLTGGNLGASCSPIWVSFVAKFAKNGYESTTVLLFIGLCALVLLCVHLVHCHVSRRSSIRNSVL
jgi:MFS family permease